MPTRNVSWNSVIVPGSWIDTQDLPAIAAYGGSLATVPKIAAHFGYNAERWNALPRGDRVELLKRGGLTPKSADKLSSSRLGTSLFADIAAPVSAVVNLAAGNPEPAANLARGLIGGDRFTPALNPSQPVVPYNPPYAQTSGRAGEEVGQLLTSLFGINRNVAEGQGTQGRGIDPLLLFGVGATVLAVGGVVLVVATRK